MLAMLCNHKERFLLKKVVLYDNESERQSIVGKYAEIYLKYYPELEENLINDIDFKEVARLAFVRNIIFKECFLSLQAFRYRSIFAADALLLQLLNLIIVTLE